MHLTTTALILITVIGTFGGAILLLLCAIVNAEAVNYQLRRRAAKRKLSIYACPSMRDLHNTSNYSPIEYAELD